MPRAHTLLVLAAIGAAAVVGTMALGLVRQNQVEVYFDNGLTAPVTISVDGESFSLHHNTAVPLKRHLRPGSHEVVVTGTSGEIERAQISIPKKNLITALTHSEFFVYNVSAAHIYRRATHVYAAEASQRGYSEQLYAFQRFFSQPEADYTFLPAPNEISSESSTARRDEFVVARDLDYNSLGNMRINEGNLAEARRAVDKALTLEPCHAGAFRNRISLMSLDGPSNEALETARSWIDSCGTGDLEAHRAYQDMMLLLGSEKALVAEYRARRRREPTAENDYLLGRLLVTGEALELYHEALAKQPSFGRAKLALAYELLGLERYDEALSLVDTGLDGTPLAPEAAYFYACAAVGAGRVSETTQRLQAMAARDPYNPTLWQARWISALAAGNWNWAESLLVEYQRNSGTDPLTHRVQLLRLRGNRDEAERRVAQEQGQMATSSEAALADFHSLFAAGRYAEAAERLDGIPQGAGDLDRLYAAAGLAMAGRRDDARARLQTLEGELETAGKDRETEFYRVAARLFMGGASNEQAIASARGAGFLMLPHAYFLAGAHERARGKAVSATRYFQKSTETALTRDFPYLAAAAQLPSQSE